MIKRIRSARRIIDNLRYDDDTTLLAEWEEESRRFLMRVKEENGIGIKRTKILATILRNGT